MRALFRITLVASLLVWCAFAQRGGGHGGGGGGGFHGGGGFGGHAAIGGGSGFRGGGSVGGFGGGRSVGGGFGGFNRGYGYGGFNRGYGYGYGGWGLGLGWGYPYYGWGYGLGYWPGYYDYPDYGYGYYPGAYSYNTSPNVTVVYPQTVAGDPPPAYAQSAHPVIRSYDQYGQETHSPANGASESPIYLIAMNDGTIHAASSYSMENGTLHYVTLQREEKTVPVSSVDRTLTNQLNRERHVNLNLGQ